MAEDVGVTGSAESSAAAPPEMDIQVTGGPTPEPVESVPAEAGAEDSGEEATPKPAGKDRLQKRFSELTRTIHEERSRREVLEQELNELRRGQAERNPQAQDSGGKSPKLEDFKDYEEYAEAKARWVAGEEIAKVSRVHAERNQRERATQTAIEIRTRWDMSEATAKEKFSDYDEVMADSEVKFSESVAVALLDSEIGPELAYYLKAHPDEAKNLAGMSPVAAARAVGKLEAKLASSPTPKPKTSAPPPPKPVTASAPAEGLSDKLDMGEWIKRRNKQVLDRRQYG